MAEKLDEQQVKWAEQMAKIERDRDWSRQRVLEDETKLATAQAQHAAELAKVPAHILWLDKYITKIEPLWAFATVWLAMIMVWGFVMMTFKKDVWPR